MKLEVVSEDVLPSERLKRLLRFGNFLGSCDDTDTYGSAAGLRNAANILAPFLE